MQRNNIFKKGYMKTKEYMLLLTILLLTIALPIINSWAASFEFSKDFSPIVNKNLTYQSSTLILTLLFLVILWKLKTKEFVQYFKKGTISAIITPVPFVGIKPTKDEKFKE